VHHGGLRSRQHAMRAAGAAEFPAAASVADGSYNAGARF
jgi:hypothetical protein